MVAGSLNIKTFASNPLKQKPVFTLQGRAFPSSLSSITQQNQLRMPKDPQSSSGTSFALPLSGLFAVAKPTGIVSMKLIEKLKPMLVESKLFIDPTNPYMGPGRGKKGQRRNGGGIKIGQGGTLDPGADGVLVIGVNRGTKQLQRFLNGSKEYLATGLLGCSTDSYDSDGAIVDEMAWEHVTKEMIEDVLKQFTGEISQMPPIYSALKMDGKALYEYARSNTPLPRPIEPRKVNIYAIQLENWSEGGTYTVSGDEEEGEVIDPSKIAGAQHSFRPPNKKVDADTLAAMKASEKLIKNPSVKPLDTGVAEVGSDVLTTPATPTITSASTSSVGPKVKRLPPSFTLRMTVGSGTYVRSIFHDIAVALNTRAHVVTLQRTRQSEFWLANDSGEPLDQSPEEEKTKNESKKSIPWEVFERGLKKRQGGIDRQTMGEEEDEALSASSDKWEEWEMAILNAFEETR